MKDLIAHVQNTRECLLITEKSIRLLIVVVLTIENELPRLIPWAGRDLNKSSINRFDGLMYTGTCVWNNVFLNVLWEGHRKNDLHQPTVYLTIEC